MMNKKEYIHEGDHATKPITTFSFRLSDNLREKKSDMIVIRKEYHQYHIVSF
jgi:hypothetical protein